jgi:hypothetical protein
MKAMWWRLTERDGQEREESVYSVYEARPHFEQVGVEPTSPLLQSSSSESSVISGKPLQLPVP